uniref:ZnMc domain-containing protein n=1 Tax=Heterorhabditis bacteriophora TaxID=37862 RepID=A0A1I7XEY2_HETBA
MKYGDFQELTDHQKSELTEAFPRTNITAVYDKLRNMRSEWAKRLKLDDGEQARLNTVEEVLAMLIYTLEFKNRIGHNIRLKGESIEEVNMDSNIATFLYQGDIVLTEDQATGIEHQNVAPRLKRQAFRNRHYPNTTWGSNVYYFFDKSANPAVKRVFRKAAQFWKDNTCINFIENSTAVNKIRVFVDSGCYSYIGRIGGTQELSLGRGCETECLQSII